MSSKLMLPWIFLFFAVTASFSDDIKLLNGTLVSATIMSASKDSLFFLSPDSLLKYVPKDSIKFVRFSTSDEVLLYSSDVIQCKILNVIHPYLIIVTRDGLQRIHNSQIMTKAYNTSGNLKVKMLPETGSLFVRSTRQQKSPKKDMFFMKISMNLLKLPLKEWKKDFYYYDAEYRPFIGIALAYQYSKLPGIVAGYDMSTWHEKSSLPYTSHVKMGYLYVGTEFKVNMLFMPSLQLLMGGHAGIFQVQGDLYTYSFRKYSENIKKMAIKPYLGIVKNLTGDISVESGVSYFYAPAIYINCDNECKQKLKLPLKGFAFFLNVKFKFPFSK